MAKDEASEKPLLDKLGVRPGMQTAVIGISDSQFLEELRKRAQVTLEEAPAGADIVFLGVEGPQDMARLRELRDTIARDGAVWVVNPRLAAGTARTPGFNSNDVMRLGLETGMVDVKIARFSDTHTATKFVIRKKDR